MSENRSKFISGKVLMYNGAAGSVETTVAQLEGTNKLTWDDAVEAEYIERVKARAADKARQMLAQAQQEVQSIREQARQEGFDQGLSEAQAQLEQARAAMADELAGALDAIEQGRKRIWEDQKQGILAVITVAVSKVLGCEVSERRREVLDALLNEAVEALDAERILTVRVHPEDAEDMEGLLAEVKDRYPSLEGWRIKPEPSMQPGGMVVETDYGKVDNTLESRRQVVEAVLEKMSLSACEDSGPAAADENAG